MKIKYLFPIIVLVIILPIIFILFRTSRWLYPLLVLGFILAGLPLLLLFLKENKRQKNIEEKFLEFVRDLVGGVKSGIPITQSIIQLKNKDFGNLTPYIRKLINQVEWGIPVKEALIIFSKETNNRVIKRSIAIVIQAEESGGNMEDVLSSVVDSVVAIKRLKEERKSSVYSQIIQGYIVFFIFIVIMLILETKLVPMIQTMVTSLTGGLSGIGFFGNVEITEIGLNFKRIFLSLILIQGFFAGLMIGKFSEGSIKYGVKHSFILMVMALLIVFTVAPP